MARTRAERSARHTDAVTESGKTWQQTKSELTRTAILDAALRCFYELGYNSTTTEKVAREAGVSRGAMLHHFPSRRDLIQAAVVHLNEKRLAAYETEEREIQEQARYTLIEEGIDIYWRQLDSWLFVVFHELQVAARTDPELARIMIPALEEVRPRLAGDESAPVSRPRAVRALRARPQPDAVPPRGARGEQVHPQPGAPAPARP